MAVINQFTSGINLSEACNNPSHKVDLLHFHYRLQLQASQDETQMVRNHDGLSA